MRFTYCLALTLASAFASAQTTFTQMDAGKKTSIRGLSVVNDKVAWVSGSNGWVSHTADRGKTWNWSQPVAYKTLDFRDIEAFSSKSAIMVNAGSPAVIVKTEDSGLTWKEVYRNNAPGIFLDGMDFWDDKRGIVFGDPIDDKLQLLVTTDGGNSWTDLSMKLPVKLDKGEASFAASGTTIRTMKGGRAWIITGGSNSRIFYTPDYGATWEFFNCPILYGQESQGPFSIAFRSAKIGIAVGGDYKADTLRNNNAVLTSDGGKSWFKPKTNPFGYRSAVEYFNDRVLVATGTSGTDLSEDGGITWKRISSDPYNSVRRAKKGKWIVLAGSGGKIVSLNIAH